MPKAEKGTAKYLANAMKSKGLQKLKWYCQVCEKQCRDDNGFKCHLTSESHLRQMLVVGENAGRHITDYSERFKGEFLRLLSRRWGTKRVRANQVYQEYIQDKNHLHMNATRWVSLTEFIKYLGRTGIVHVDETEKGWYIAWIDNDPKTLAKQAAYQSKERADLDDEERQRKYIKEQIARAQAAAAASSNDGPVASGSGSGSSGSADEDDAPGQSGSASDDQAVEEERKPTGPIKLSFGLPAVAKKEVSPPATAATSEQPAEAASAPTQAPAPIKINPLKKSNPLKSNPLKAKKEDKAASAPAPPVAPPRTAVEEIMMQDMERKRRRDERDNHEGSKRARV